MMSLSSLSSRTRIMRPCGHTDTIASASQPRDGAPATLALEEQGTGVNALRVRTSSSEFERLEMAARASCAFEYSTIPQLRWGGDNDKQPLSQRGGVVSGGDVLRRKRVLAARSAPLAAPVRPLHHVRVNDVPSLGEVVLERLPRRPIREVAHVQSPPDRHDQVAPRRHRGGGGPHAFHERRGDAAARGAPAAEAAAEAASEASAAAAASEAAEAAAAGLPRGWEAGAGGGAPGGRRLAEIYKLCAS